MSNNAVFRVVQFKVRLESLKERSAKLADRIKETEKAMQKLFSTLTEEERNQVDSILKAAKGAGK